MKINVVKEENTPQNWSRPLIHYPFGKLYPNLNLHKKILRVYMVKINFVDLFC